MEDFSIPYLSEDNPSPAGDKWFLDKDYIRIPEEGILDEKVSKNPDLEPWKDDAIRNFHRPFSSNPFRPTDGLHPSLNYHRPFRTFN